MKRYSDRFLLGLYVSMLKIRFCEESLVPDILSGRIKCPVHLCSGQEAVAAGVCAALQPQDSIFGNHRSHGHYLAKGGSLEALIAEVYGRKSGCCRGRGGSMHLVCPPKKMLGAAPIVAGTISLAVGSALAGSIRRDRSVSVSFFGDGAAGEGALYESLNLAALWRLPLIFVCENNLYSTHMPLRECRAEERIFKAGEAFGVRSMRRDGNDVLGVYETARMAVEDCRKGKGPVFIEFMTYRQRGHVGADDNVQGLHTDIRPEKELRSWKRRDPLARFRSLLLSRFPVSTMEKTEKSVASAVARAYQRACAGPLPSPGELSDHVFK